MKPVGPKIWTVPLGADGTADADASAIAFDQEACEASIASNRLSDTGGKLRVSYTSMVTPSSLLEFDVASRAFRLLKQQPVPNYDATKYATKQLSVTARDGESAPVTLLWRPDAMGDGGEDLRAARRLFANSAGVPDTNNATPDRSRHSFDPFVRPAGLDRVVRVPSPTGGRMIQIRAR